MVATRKHLTLSTVLSLLLHLESEATQLHLNGTSNITVIAPTYFEALDNTTVHSEPFSHEYFIHTHHSTMPRFTLGILEDLELFWNGHLISNKTKMDSQWLFLRRACKKIRHIKVITVPPDRNIVIPDGDCEPVSDHDDFNFSVITFQPQVDFSPDLSKRYSAQLKRDLDQTLSPRKLTAFPEFASSTANIDPMLRMAEYKAQQRAYLENPGRFGSGNVMVNIAYSHISAKNLQHIPHGEGLVAVVGWAPDLRVLFDLVFKTLSELGYLNREKGYHTLRDFKAQVCTGTELNIQRLSNYLKQFIKDRYPDIPKDEIKFLLEELTIHLDQNHLLSVQQEEQEERKRESERIRKEMSHQWRRSTLQTSPDDVPLSCDGATAMTSQSESIGTGESGILDLLNNLIDITNHSANVMINFMQSVQPDLTHCRAGVLKGIIRVNNTEDKRIDPEVVLNLLKDVKDLKLKIQEETQHQLKTQAKIKRKASRLSKKKRCSQGPSDEKI